MLAAGLSSLPRGPTGRASNDVAVIGIKLIDAALLPKAGECRRQLSATYDCFHSKLTCLRDLNCRVLRFDRDHSKQAVCITVRAPS